MLLDATGTCLYTVQMIAKLVLYTKCKYQINNFDNFKDKSSIVSMYLKGESCIFHKESISVYRKCLLEIIIIAETIYIYIYIYFVVKIISDLQTNHLSAIYIELKNCIHTRKRNV